MKNHRFWRNLWTIVGIAGVVIGLAALVLPEHGTGTKPYIGLATFSLAVAAASFIAAYQLMWAVRRFAVLDSGDEELARWWIDPSTWASFVQADTARQAGIDRQWGSNAVRTPPALEAPIEVVVSREAMRIGDAYHELDRDIMLGTRYLPGMPVMLEFYFRIPKPRGTPIPFIIRFPVEAGAEQKAQTVLAHYNTRNPPGPVARAVMAPGQAARRDPRKARRVALITAAIGAVVGAIGTAVANSSAEPLSQENPRDVLVILAAAGGFATTGIALLLAAIFHSWTRRAY